MFSLPELLKDGTKAMLRYQPPPLPACTQCPAVHTRLDLPGWAGSFTTAAEQTLDPWGVMKKSVRFAIWEHITGVACPATAA
jgi:hypothetical protein